MTKLPAFAKTLLLIVGLTTTLAIFMNYRLSHAGDWLPELPEAVGENNNWSSYADPIPQSVLEMLGNARGTGRTYVNSFGEAIGVSVITASSFEAFHDPTVCSVGQGFVLKAETRPNLAGEGTQARAMLMRNPTRNIDAIQYYWLQNDDGSTQTAKRMGSIRDIIPRTQTGVDAVLMGHRTVLMRVFAIVPTGDVGGEQSLRNVHEVSRALYLSLLKETRPDAAAQMAKEADKTVMALPAAATMSAAALETASPTSGRRNAKPL